MIVKSVGQLSKLQKKQETITMETYIQLIPQVLVLVVDFLWSSTLMAHTLDHNGEQW